MTTTLILVCPFTASHCDEMTWSTGTPCGTSHAPTTSELRNAVEHAAALIAQAVQFEQPLTQLCRIHANLLAAYQDRM